MIEYANFVKYGFQPLVRETVEVWLQLVVAVMPPVWIQEIVAMTLKKNVHLNLQKVHLLILIILRELVTLRDNLVFC